MTFFLTSKRQAWGPVSFDVLENFDGFLVEYKHICIHGIIHLLQIISFHDCIFKLFIASTQKMCQTVEKLLDCIPELLSILVTIIFKGEFCSLDILTCVFLRVYVSLHFA